MVSCCKFEDFLSEALRHRLVCGMSSESIQKVLLTKSDLTLEKAIEISQGMDAAAKQAKELKGSPCETPVLAVSPPVQARPCSRCSRGNHAPSECKFKTATCHKCGKVGHIAPVCHSGSKSSKKGVTKKTKWVTTTEPESTQTSVQTN